MEVNPAYPLSRLGTQDITVCVLKKRIVFNVQVKNHPPSGKHRANCYQLQAMMITWGKRVTHELQVSNWLYMQPEYADLDFEFQPKAATEHWLLCLLIRLGMKDKPIGVMTTTGMQVIDAGSFVKEDMEILEKRHKEQAVTKATAAVKQKTEEVKMVKPKRML